MGRARSGASSKSTKGRGVDSGHKATSSIFVCAFVSMIAVAVLFFRSSTGDDKDHRRSAVGSEQMVRTLAGINNRPHFPVRFKNLCPLTVDVWWQDDESMSIVHQYTLHAGEQTSTLGEAGRKFFFSPEDDPSNQLQHFIVGDEEESDNLFVLKDTQNPESILMKRWAMEEEFRANYVKETGKHWLGYYPRASPEHFMWAARQVGDITSVSSDAGQFECNPVSARSCKADESVSLDVEVVATEPKVFLVKNFLSVAEADHMALLGANGLSRSKTTKGTSSSVSTVRTSSNAWVPRTTDAVTNQIYRRVASVVKIPDLNMTHIEDVGVVEAMQVVHYDVGQEYREHYDWWVSEQKGRRSRFLTFLLYLTDKASEGAGGETVFPSCTGAGGNHSIAIHPGKGGAVFFYNMLEDGNPDGRSIHSAAPVLEGEKWLANVWIWDPHVGGGSAVKA